MLPGVNAANRSRPRSYTHGVKLKYSNPLTGDLRSENALEAVGFSSLASKTDTRPSRGSSDYPHVWGITNIMAKDNEIMNNGSISNDALKSGFNNDRLEYCTNNGVGGYAVRAQPAINQGMLTAHPEHQGGWRVLLIEEDLVLRNLLANYLEEHNLNVVAVSSGQQVARQLMVMPPSAVVFALHHGRKEEFDILRNIRSRSDAPIIISGDDRCSEIEKVTALDLGGDDCLTKPFGFRELLARIRVKLRRHEAQRTTIRRHPERGRCQFGQWQLDRRLRRLTTHGGTDIALTKREYSLLLAFLDAPQQTLTREQLLDATHICDDVSERSIDLIVLRLRRKLGDNLSIPRIIRTERGIGYIFDLRVYPGSSH
jgi:two-component system, OmpR family, response regulator